MSKAEGWFVLGAGVILLGAWAGLSGALVVDRIARGDRLHELMLGPMLLGIPFVPLGLIFAVKGWLGRHLSIDLHEGGVVLTDGANRDVMLWEEVHAVFCDQRRHVAELGFGLDVTSHHSAKLVLHAPFKPPIVVDERFPRHCELVDTVHRAAAAAMLPRCEASLHTGQRVAFGPVGVDTWGLHLAHAAYPWAAIGGVRWEPRGAAACYAIYDTHGGALAEIPSALPNPLVFEQVVARFNKLSEASDRSVPRGDALIGAAQQALRGSAGA